LAGEIGESFLRYPIFNSFFDLYTSPVQISRSLHDLLQLKERLSGSLYAAAGAFFEDGAPVHPQLVQDTLNSYLQWLGSRAWECETLVNFLEDTPIQSHIASIRFRLLNSQVGLITLWNLYLFR
jgi:hypothetical protein